MISRSLPTKLDPKQASKDQMKQEHLKQSLVIFPNSLGTLNSMEFCKKMEAWAVILGEERELRIFWCCNEMAKYEEEKKKLNL